MFLLKKQNRAIIFEYSNFCNVKSSENLLSVWIYTTKPTGQGRPAFRRIFAPTFHHPSLPPHRPASGPLRRFESSVVIIPVGCPSPSEIAMDQTFV